MIHADQQESTHTPVQPYTGGMNPLLEIKPNKFVEFVISANASSSRLITLCNISDNWVAFKIKTTSPRSYNVRPSMGVIPPSQNQAIRLTLSALPNEVYHELFSEDASNERGLLTNNRFLILSYPLLEKPTEQLTVDFWNTIEKNLLRDQKLHVMLKKRESSIDGTSQDNASEKVVPNGLPPYAPRSVNISNATIQAKSTAGGQGVPAKPGQQSSSFTEKSIGNKDVVDPVRKYNEVVHYCLALEKKIATVESENRDLKRQLEVGTCSNLFNDLVTKLLSRPFLILFIPAIVTILLKVLRLW